MAGQTRVLALAKRLDEIMLNLHEKEQAVGKLESELSLVKGQSVQKGNLLDTENKALKGVVDSLRKELALVKGQHQQKDLLKLLPKEALQES